MQGHSIVNVTDLTEDPCLGGFRIRIVALCALVALLDGLDVQIVGVTAPAMAATLNISAPALGVALSATLLGLMIGAMTLGTYSDRIGRKPILLMATATFGALTIATGLVQSWDQLIAARFLAGVGLGGAMPSFAALASDYAPRSKRALLASLLWTGFPLGGVVGGLLGSRLIQPFGWRVMFYFSGAVPLLVSPILAAALPESMTHLVRTAADPVKIRSVIMRLRPGIAIPPDVQFVVEDAPVVRARLGLLFAQGRGGMTILLWASYFAAFLMLITNVGWAPVLLHKSGLSVPRTGLVLAAFNLGSVVGTAFGGVLIGHRLSRITLSAAFVGSMLTLGLVGQMAGSAPLVTALQATAGIFLGVGSSALIALAAFCYPAAIRSTGIGWAMGIGRLGSFTGPLVLGLLIAGGWHVSGLFTLLGAVALCPALCMTLIRTDPRPHRNALATEQASAT